VPVLQRKELEDSPLADLHAIASELAIEGYRTLRRPDLVAAILGEQGGGEEGRADLEAATEPDEAPVSRAARRPSQGRRRRRRDPRPAAEAASEPGPAAEEAPESAPGGPPEPAPEAEPEPELEAITGVLDILPNGSGFVRRAASASPDDAYLSPAQIRRCELRAGDEVSGPLRPARRNERHPSLVRVETVNGGDAEPPEERPHFADLTPVHATERLPAPAALDAVPFGKGSRVGIWGAPGAGGTRLLREIAATLGERAAELAVSVVLVAVRPEEVTAWRREMNVPVTGGSFDGSLEAQAQAAELAVERAKRVAERGGDAVVLIDSLERLASGVARRLLGAARKAEEGGSLTLVAVMGLATEPQRQASTLVALDAPGDAGEPRVSPAGSGTMRADLL